MREYYPPQTNGIHHKSSGTGDIWARRFDLLVNQVASNLQVLLKQKYKHHLYKYGIIVFRHLQEIINLSVLCRHHELQK